MKRNVYEAHIPTEQEKKAEDFRLPCTHENPQGTSSDQASPQNRQKAPHSLKYFFPKSSRLRTRRDFFRVKCFGNKKIGNYLVIDYRYGKGAPKLGITVSKKFGKAVQRNRFKRVVREAFRLSIFPLGLEINVYPKCKGKNISLHNALSDFDKLKKIL